MTKHILAIGLIAALAACNSEDHTIVAGGPVDDTDIAASGDVVLPPSILTSKVYRCANNVIAHVDWLSDGKSATIRTDKAATPNMVSSAEEGTPMTSASGYSLDGTAQAGSVRIGVPGSGTQTCKA